MTTTEKLAEREAFEAEYRLIFPLTTQLEPDKFRREPEGDYEDPTVQVAWHLWQARAALAATPAAPQGWKLVPVEPTPEMLKAADDGDDAYTLRHFGPGVQRVQQGPYDHWCAMLAAAPEAATPAAPHAELSQPANLKESS